MSETGDARFLVVRLGSLGDIVHTLPAAAALRDAFPSARIDWVVERKWEALLLGNSDVSNVIPLDRNSWAALRSCIRRLRAGRYACAIDFQGLYKSAILAWLSGAPRRIGFHRGFAREGGAAVFYTQRVTPAVRHVVEQNLALAQSAGPDLIGAGARRAAARFSLSVSAEADGAIAGWLRGSGAEEFYVASPGGGWRSKCWPAERYGELCRELSQRHGWRAVVNYGPGEKELADAVCRAAAPAQPAAFTADLPQLVALLKRAKVVVAGDTGPLHLAVALGTPVVGLYGPTDPARNGPYTDADIVVRNARSEETTYKRGNTYSASMLSISAGQVIAAVEKRLGMR